MRIQSTTIRYYFLVIAFSLSAGFILISAFVGFKCMSVASWEWGNTCLDWIIGLEVIGFIFFGGTLILSAIWKKSDLIARPEMADEQYKLFLISMINGIVLITSLLTGMLTIGFSAGTFGVCLLVPLTLLLWLFSAVRFAFGFKGANVSLFVNSIFLILAVLLQWTNSSIDFGFRWRLNEYKEIVRMVERGEFQPNQGGFATLPANFQWLSDSGEIVILQREGFTTVIFFTQLDFPGEYYAIAYRSDDSIPTNFYDDRCDRGWRVQDDIPQWFVCISTRLEGD